jgi:DNA-binding NarL/FixJ family response regulator
VRVALPSAAVVVEPGRRSHRTLIVDDSDVLRRLVCTALARSGRFDVVGEAENGSAALATAETQQPEVVLLDLSMPVMDGVTALPLLRGAVPSAVIVVFTSFDHKQMRVALAAAGADGILEKGLIPINAIADRLDAVVAAVRSARRPTPAISSEVPLG